MWKHLTYRRIKRGGWHASIALALLSAGCLQVGADTAASVSCVTGHPGYHRPIDINADLGIFAPLAPGESAGYLLFGDTVGWAGFAGGGNPFRGARVTRTNAVVPYDACTGEVDAAAALPELDLGSGRRGYSATIPTGAVVANGVLYSHFMYGDVFREGDPALPMGGMRGHGLWQFSAGAWSFVPSWLAPVPPPGDEAGQLADLHADNDPFLQSALTLTGDRSALLAFGTNSNLFTGTIAIGRVDLHDGWPDWLGGRQVSAWPIGGQVRDISAYTALSGAVYVMWLDEELGPQVTRVRQRLGADPHQATIDHTEIDDLDHIGYGGSILDVRDPADGGRWYLVSFSNAETYTTSMRWVRNAKAQAQWEREVACALGGECPPA